MRSEFREERNNLWIIEISKRPITDRLQDWVKNKKVICIQTDRTYFILVKNQEETHILHKESSKIIEL